MGEYARICTIRNPWVVTRDPCRIIQYNLSAEFNQNVESKRKSAESKMGKWGVQLVVKPSSLKICRQLLGLHPQTPTGPMVPICEPPSPRPPISWSQKILKLCKMMGWNMHPRHFGCALVKVTCHSPLERRRGAHVPHCPFIGHCVSRWVYHCVCDAWPVRRQTHGYLSSRRASLSFGRYQFILLGDRGTCVWTACTESLHESGMAASRNRDLLIASPTP